MFEIHYCEYNRSNTDCDRIFRPQGSGDYLFLLLKTPMKFRMNGKISVLRENACLLYTPGVCQDYQAVRKFRNSYMHFSTDLALEKKYPIPVNRPFYPAAVSAIDQLLKEIQREYLEKSPYYQDQIRILTESLILKASRSLHHPAPAAFQDATLLQTFQALRLEMLEACQEDWPVERLLARCSMGKSQFYRYYRLFFHTTPKAELMEARMDKARILLTNRALGSAGLPAVRISFHPAFYPVFSPAVWLFPRPVSEQGKPFLKNSFRRGSNKFTRFQKKIQTYRPLFAP